MKKLVFMILGMIMVLSACSSTGIQNNQDPSGDAMSHHAVLKTQPIVPLDTGFVNAVNGFGFKAASLLYDTENNFAFSPSSIELALCMTRAGAAGDTAAAMATTLGLTDLSDEAIIDACRSLMWRANTGGMEAANAIWLSKEYTFSDDFVNTCTEEFMADAFPLVIPGAKDAVNGWAKEKTHGRISDIISEELPDETRIVLANALYYLGDWERPFDANNTWDDVFTSPGGQVTAPFMHSDWWVPYYQNDDFSMITLNFKSDDDEGQYAMAFLLPAEGKKISDMLKTLNADTFSKALEDAVEQEVWIKLPKFEFSYFTKLKETLTDMGMGRAFSISDADFSAMTQEPNEIYIGEVLHKCYIRVDELGAEAAAVTMAVASEGAAPMEEEPAKFYADRPFVFAIYSLEDGTISFMGAVNDPTAE